MQERAKHELEMQNERFELTSQKNKMGLERQLSSALEREKEATFEAD